MTMNSDRGEARNAPIGELIDDTRVLLDVDVKSRDELLARAAAFLAGRCSLSQSAILDSLEARERLGSTALGHGVALPHARIRGLQKPVAAFVRTRTPIDFDAPDHRPVNVFLVLLVPAEASEQHLALMSCAARQFADRDFRLRLKTTADAYDIAQLLGRLPEDS